MNTPPSPPPDELDVFLPESEVPVRGAAAPSKRSFARLAVFAVLGVMAVATGALWLRGSAAGAPPPSGSLRVESTPAGADVLVDGIKRGETPFTLSLAVGPHRVVVRSGERTQEVPVTIERGTTMVHHVTWGTADVEATPAEGNLRVLTEPASAARVTVDGVDRGVTPLTLTDLAPGEHDVVVREDTRVHRRSVTIQAGATASLVISTSAAGIASGWLSARASAPLQIYEAGKLVGTTDLDRIMLPVGEHAFEFSSEALGYRTLREVRIVAGQVANIDLPLPRAPLSVNAAPWARVWVDGQPLGETPIGNVMQTIGSHEVVFRHPELGERRVRAVVTLNEPARLAVDMREP